MRAAPSFWAALALAAVAAIPSIAEAGPRSRLRRAPGGPVAGAPTRADDALAAILAATPTGGFAFLPRGVFRSALVIERPMTVVASPRGTTIDGTGLGLPGVRVLPGVTDVTIIGLRVQDTGGDGVLAEGGNHRLQLRSLTVTAAGADGARFLDAADALVDRCRFDANAGDGLDASGPRLRATRLLVRANGGTGIVVRGDAALVSDCGFEGGAEGVRFEAEKGIACRNTFRGVGVAARLGSTSDASTFEGNDVRGGVSALLADPGSRRGTAAANHVAGAAGDAFGLAGSWHTLTANEIEDVQGAGIDADGSSLRIQGNDIRRAGAAGVSLRGDDHVVDANRIADTSGPALVLEGDGNLVSLNQTTGGEDGILLRGATNRAVSNTVTDSRGEGLVLAGDGNTLEGNVLRGAAGNGIRVASGAANHLIANSIAGCGDRGFVDDGSGTVLERNRIE